MAACQCCCLFFSFICVHKAEVAMVRLKLFILKREADVKSFELYENHTQTSACTHTHTYRHTHIHTDTHSHRHAHRHTHTQAHTHTDRHTHIYTVCGLSL